LKQKSEKVNNQQSHPIFGGYNPSKVLLKEKKKRKKVKVKVEKEYREADE